MFRISPRIYASIVLNIFLFIFTLSMTKVDTDSWHNLFYYITLVSALLFNINDSVFQGAFCSLIGTFPEKYMSALSQGRIRWTHHKKSLRNLYFTFHSGQAIGGTLASLISVSMLAIGGSDSNGALFSFSFAAIFLFIVLCMFYYATKQEFYQHYSALKPGEGDNKESVDFRQVLRCTWTFNVAAFLNFFVTLGVFPAYFRYKFSLLYTQDSF